VRFASRLSGWLLVLLICLSNCSSGDDPPGSPGAGNPPPDLLPEDVYFKTNRTTFNTRYTAAVKDESVWVREKGNQQAEWVDLGSILPGDLAGDVTEIAMDDEHILALNSRREIFTMWSALDEIPAFHWQKAWGLPFWQGPGMQLPEDLLAWDFSVVSIPQDLNWHDPNGNLFRVGAPKCSHIIMLRNEGRWITFNDPWLPTDLSYGIGTPKRCRFRSASLSASGSTIFIMNPFGDMYTRFFDFDISGLDEFIDLLYGYAYEDQGGAARPKIQLPPEDWIQQPKIRGRITDRISIHKLGRQQNGWDRVLRVEGMNEDGRTGYYEKGIAETRSEDWVFHETGRPPLGTLIENKSYDSSDEWLGPNEDLRFSLNMENLSSLDPRDPADWAGEVLDFNCYCPPHTLRVYVRENLCFDLRFHTTEGIRVTPRKRGLDQEPRRFRGAIEVPEDLLHDLEQQDPKVRGFVQETLGGRQFTYIEAWATLNELEVQLKEGSQTTDTFRFLR
jgi:hypothetical protein